METRLSIEGGIFGHLVGNALGIRCRNSVFSISKTLTRSIFAQQLARAYAKAGAMTLCTMSSITDSERIDPEDILNRFHEWYVGSYLASSAKIESDQTISQAIRNYGNGMPPDRCGSKNENPDNSALIRMLPVALWNANEPLPVVVQDAHDVTKITNQQIAAQVCSALYCSIIRSFLTGNAENSSDILSAYYNDTHMSEYSEELAKIRDYKNSGKTSGGKDLLDSFWSAIKIFSKNISLRAALRRSTIDNFEEAIEQAILLKNDCPNTACLVGSLMGTVVGINDIPQRWLNQLELSQEAKNVIAKFLKMAIKRN
ncbi:MAG: ADP-ribosylglycohydrolase family protein [Promethearchaeota archaeon]|jgi:ADP-ribosylglycohydrolase